VEKILAISSINHWQHEEHEDIPLTTIHVFQMSVRKKMAFRIEKLLFSPKYMQP
jgi:hypothetical protein